MFDGAYDLKVLTLNGNQLGALPAKIFNSLRELRDLNLSDNRLVELDKNEIRYFNESGQLSKLRLGNNMWKCDAMFLDFIEVKKDKIDYDQIGCYDSTLYTIK